MDESQVHPDQVPASAGSDRSTTDIPDASGGRTVNAYLGINRTWETEQRKVGGYGDSDRTSFSAQSVPDFAPPWGNGGSFS